MYLRALGHPALRTPSGRPGKGSAQRLGHATLAIVIILPVSSDPAADLLWDSWLHLTEPQCPRL